ncbi:hypothetical protein FKP32DRAFT_1538323, partial [Trametes sanguinea]
LDRLNCDEAVPIVNSMPKEEVLACESRLKRGVRKVYPEGGELTEEVHRLFQQHGEEISRAMCGTTISLALVAVEERFMWAAGVGNCTVAISTAKEQRKRKAEQICTRHSILGAGDAYTVHCPANTQELSIANGDLLGAVHHKARSSYMGNLFQHASQDWGTRLPKPPAVVEKVDSNLSLKADASVRFVDLKPMWDKDPVLVLYTDGVDCLVNGSTVFTPRLSSSNHPLTIIASMLAGPQRDVDVFPTKSPISLELALGHGVEFGWSQAHGVDNEAVEILFNLLGGSNADRLEQVVNWDRAIDDDPNLLIDDTTIII